ncbi:MAG: hypothetical protein ACQEXQ_08840 [Bacillota bacterium]
MKLTKCTQRRREQFELEFAVLEAELARADEELCRLDSIGDWKASPNNNPLIFSSCSRKE